MRPRYLGQLNDMYAGPTHISGRTVFAGLLVNLVFGLTAFAQQPDTRQYDSEEDLWEALREGEITHDEYLDLLETARLGYEDALVPSSDWEGLPGSEAGYLTGPDTTERIAVPAERATRNSRGMRWSWRTGYNGGLTTRSTGDGYTTVRFRSPTLAGLLDWRHDGTRGQLQRRVVEWRGRHVRLQAGNVEPRFGRGLVVGRRSRLIGSSSANRPDGDWWQPTRSRFNGLWLSIGQNGGFSGEVVVSDIRSNNLTERMATAQLTAGIGLMRIGLTALAGEIRRRDSAAVMTERVAGGHVRVGRDGHEFLAEIAAEHGGATARAAEALWRFEGGRFHARAWSYSPAFLNPWSGGPGHSDTRKVLLDAIGESYISRTIGERGFSLATRIDPQQKLLGGEAGARWEWMTHSEAPNEPLQHSWAIRLHWKRGRLTLRPFGRGATDENRISRYGFGSSADIGTPDRHLSARIESGRHNVGRTRYLRTSLGVKWRLNEVVRLAPTVRWVDPDLDRPGDGYWYLYFTEAILPLSVVRIDAVLVWQRYEQRGRGDGIEMRLRLVTGT